MCISNVINYSQYNRLRLKSIYDKMDSEFLYSNSSEYSDDDDFEENLFRKKSSFNIVSQKINRVVDLQIENKLTHQATSNIVKLLNQEHTDIKLPENKQAIKALAYEDLEYNFFLKCEQCNEIIEHNTKCINCQNVLKIDSKKNNFLVYFYLEHQIRRILNIHFETIINYLNRERSCDTLSDIDDGLLYKKICAETPPSLLVLALTLNVDGANIFKSSRDSLWPVQLVLNCLPPAIRYLPENIIISTLHYARTQPCMTDLLYLLAKEIDYLNEKSITIYKENEFYNFVPKMLLCACDLPARAKVQNMKGSNGKFGCSFCLHPGVAVENMRGRSTIRFIKHESTMKLRTHSETLEKAQKVVMNDSIAHGKDNSIHGIKGYSSMLLFDDFNTIESFPVDVMHGPGLGITKDLVEIWLGIKTIPAPPYKDYKIKSKQSREILEKRIINLRPTSVFKRNPRSIFEIAHFKASEMFNLLWYYLRYAIVGVLPTRVVKHFEMFSAATFILCQKEIKIDEIKLACGMLKKFAEDYELIYGKGAITMNVHLLNHYTEVILNCGPLWCYNLFPFENNIGVLKEYVCGNTDVLKQIAMKYSRSRKYETIEKTNGELNHTVASGPITITFKQEHIDVFGKYGHSLDLEAAQVWRKAKINDIVYTSKYYKQTKSSDYFVELKNGRIGIVEFFFGEKLMPNLFLEVFEKTHYNYHWTEVTSSKSYEIHPYESIKRKLLFLKVGSIEYVSNEPNMYGAFFF